MEYRASRQSLTSSNHLLKPDEQQWNTNMNNIEIIKSQSQSLTNIAGKIIQEKND